ncbi:MAG: hypothetical protein KDD41_06930 [Flavobacteriales bacterium]|nr:hypothetical protein [Flavobacteriales bacterium]
MSTFSKFSFFLIVLILIACGENTTEQAENASQQPVSNTSQPNEPETAPISHDTLSAEATKGANTPTVSKCVLIAFTVNDFNSWNENFKSKPVSESLLGYLTHEDDANSILLIKPSRDHQEAKKKAEDPKFHNRLLKLGGNSDINTRYLDIIWANESIAPHAYRILITHEVRDVNQWKTAFEADQTNREQAGLADAFIATDIENPNLVTVILATDDLEKAKKKFREPATEKTLEQAGVIFKPEISYWVSK